MLRFDELVRRARMAGENGDLASEARLLADALSLWSGMPIADIRSDVRQRDVVPRLLESWFKESGRYHDVCLALGRHSEIVGELRSLTAKYPYQERRWLQPMTALHRCDRKGEALESYTTMTRGDGQAGVDCAAGFPTVHQTQDHPAATAYPTPDSMDAHAKPAARLKGARRR
ncbi:AfsR/SARP family transcriptional regulator [Streptomyces sp. NPDC090442]|uniref:AfsR/SARP family transcriptional regulator n=1 Tax=Streptomyces sp. NPDC090442 TaxID=3365962 RepID=UPI00380AF382